jgi:hypothetical protein
MKSTHAVFCCYCEVTTGQNARGTPAHTYGIPLLRIIYKNQDFASLYVILTALLLEYLQSIHDFFTYGASLSSLIGRVLFYPVA